MPYRYTIKPCERDNNCCCRKNASTGLQCCLLVPMCLLVSATESDFTRVFAIISLLAAVTVALCSVVHNIPSHLCLFAAASYVFTFIVWIFRAAALGTGMLSYSL